MMPTGAAERVAVAVTVLVHMEMISVTYFVAGLN